MFQSALRSGERSDRGWTYRAHIELCFNPRSARVSGATAQPGPSCGLRRCFNPRSARVSGATKRPRELHDSSVFQSALRSGERSDDYQIDNPPSTAVSIRAPLG